MKYQQYLKLCTFKFLQEQLKLKEINNSVIIPAESLSNISKFTIKRFSGLVIFTNKPYSCHLFALMNLPRYHVFADGKGIVCPVFSKVLSLKNNHPFFDEKSFSALNITYNFSKITPMKVIIKTDHQKLNLSIEACQNIASVLLEVSTSVF